MEVQEEVSRLTRKVTTLEDILSDFIYHSERDSRLLRDEMRMFKDEMSDFKNEMSDFKNEMRVSTKDLNKKMGDLSRKLGTFAEDFAAPNMPRVAEVYFHEPNIINHFVRWTRFDPIVRSEMFEADAVTETENIVFFLEAKFSPRNDDIKEMPERIKAFRRWFPEFSNKKLVTIFASWSINENHLRMLTKMGVYAMVVGENTMQLANFEAIKK